MALKIYGNMSIRLQLKHRKFQGHIPAFSIFHILFSIPIFFGVN